MGDAEWKQKMISDVAEMRSDIKWIRESIKKSNETISSVQQECDVRRDVIARIEYQHEIMRGAAKSIWPIIRQLLMSIITALLTLAGYAQIVK